MKKMNMSGFNGVAGGGPKYLEQNLPIGWENDPVGKLVYQQTIDNANQKFGENGYLGFLNPEEDKVAFFKKKSPYSQNRLMENMIAQKWNWVEGLIDPEDDGYEYEYYYE